MVVLGFPPKSYYERTCTNYYNNTLYIYITSRQKVITRAPAPTIIFRNRKEVGGRGDACMVTSLMYACPCQQPRGGGRRSIDK